MRIRIACWLVRLAAFVLSACAHEPQIQRAVDVKEAEAWNLQTKAETKATTVLQAKRDRKVVREKLRTDGTPYERTTEVAGEVSTSTTDASGLVTSDGAGNAERAAKLNEQQKPATTWPWWVRLAAIGGIALLAGAAGLFVARRLLGGGWLP